MGCDVHMYVEYRKPDRFSANGAKHWQSFGGRINPGRDYALFGMLASVRGGVALIEPRGLPDDLAYYSQSDARIWISTDGSSDESSVSLETALKYEKWGSKLHYDQNGRANFVDHPDWHSHSWLTTDELQQAMKATESVDFGEDSDPEWRYHGECDDECYALVASMRELEKRRNEVRVVFWFDN
jgi:hypothetical protein